MQIGGKLTLAACMLLLVFLLGAVTRSGFVPFPGSSTIWTLPAGDSVGCFRSDGAGTMSIVSCVAGAGTGDASTNTATSVVNEVALFADTTGKLFKRSTGTGVATLISGVLGTRTAPTGALVGIDDVQVLTNKDVVPMLQTLTDAATVTVNVDTTKVGLLLSVSQTTTFANPSHAGTVPTGKSFILMVTSASPQNIFWGSEFLGTTPFPLPSVTTGGGKIDMWGYIKHSTAKYLFQPMNTGF